MGDLTARQRKARHAVAPPDGRRRGEGVAEGRAAVRDSGSRECSPCPSVTRRAATSDVRAVCRTDARSLLRDLFSSEADLLPDLEQEILRVQIHPMSNPRSNRAIAHLLAHVNAAEFTYPGTDLRLVSSIAGEAETPNLVPHQIPADQEV